jgi:hypothetical protein
VDVTLHWADLIAIAATVAAGAAICYALLLLKLRALLADRQLKIADQVGALDEAIRALETRIARHQAVQAMEAAAAREPGSVTEVAAESALANESEQTAEISAEVQAVVAAAAVATLGPNAVVRSVEAVPSPWTQQGRVLVQGGHNLRVRR